MTGSELTTTDRFEIFEQLNLHQRLIDTPWGRESAERYADLYWPEGKFNVHDLRDSTFEGRKGMKDMFDYAHSVFPLDKWYHSMGVFEIAGEGDDATANWRWVVSWKADHIGTVSTGTYSDRFQRRNGVWKCLERTSNIDPNWPGDQFQKYIDAADKTFRAS
ncbi:SnoaL-like domain-containing protein [Mesorhizobium albiziae]|uniref:SnoaL-like domain-containing protein n=1 Tax=Neomesorhizobium albiziae TaxID=335020 RepID=A0A1I3WFA6_9HYPH|nr:nuclear transport factor 2 family protein [Mesorhizobium albiziae]GLS31575.1 hypothetical protein GCM10007937_32850 [Mesorhizobium albiziae]SFK06070.1 SnoaL-like domain-containing protein [Mesorhizobium albiziae]